MEVLLATYNGERFLREQIDSILAQDYENLGVLARDDGSSDGTVELLDEYAKQIGDRLRVMPRSQPTGSAQANFLLLLKASTADYICFSDQDDMWSPDKVSRTKQAMDRLEARWGRNLPLLVFTDLRVVDDKLGKLHESFWKFEKLDPERIHRLAAVLVENVVTGCTAMLNRPLVDLSLRMPPEAAMHDRWVALLASAMGKASAIKAQTVHYRQHDHNVIGSTEQRIQSLSEFTLRVCKTDARMLQWRKDLRQARSFLKVYEAELSPKSLKTLAAYLRCGTSKSRFVRIYCLFRYGFWRAGLLRNLATLVDRWKARVDDQEAG